MADRTRKWRVFFVFDYEKQYSECIETLSNWVRTGALDPIEHISYGIDTLPDALSDLYVGNNAGVRIVEVGRPDLALENPVSKHRASDVQLPAAE